MFTIEFRDHVRQRILELAKADPRVTAGAFTGSMAFEAGDRWSDIDIAFGVAGEIEPEALLNDWTLVLHREFEVLDHFDLHSGPSIYRVFLLLSGLEADVAVTPAEAFGANGPHFRALFGTSKKLEPAKQPDASFLIGLCWHHVLHARVCIERHKPWQAEYWISEIRHHLLELACLRLGENPSHGRGFDRLPSLTRDPLVNTLVRSLDELELRRALAETTMCFISELKQWDAPRCARLLPILQEFGNLQTPESSAPHE